MTTNGCVEILSLDTNTNAILFSQYYASKSAKSRLPPKIELRIATDLMEIVMTIVVAASIQLSGQLAKLTVARSKT